METKNFDNQLIRQYAVIVSTFSLQKHRVLCSRRSVCYEMPTSRTLGFALLVSLQALVFCACNDGKNNVVQVADASTGNTIQISNGLGQTYTSNFQPSCYK